MTASGLSGFLAELGQGVAGAPAGPFWLGAALLALASLAAFWTGFRELRHARLIEDTPTSRIRSAAQGYVELCGFARLLPGPDIFSPLSRARCAWWRYRIEHLETVQDGQRRRREWRVVEEACSEELFLLADETGECIVDPHGARAWPSLRRRWYGATSRPLEVPATSPWIGFGDWRYTEELITVGDPLYALGRFRSQTAVRADDEAAELRERLRQWKAEPRELLRRFDADGDGEISAAEWETARRTALEEIRAEHLEHALQPDLHVLCRPPDGREFLISTLSEKGLAWRLRARALGLAGAGLAGGLVTVWLLLQRSV